MDHGDQTDRTDPTEQCRHGAGISGVQTLPGATAFTRILFYPSSCARALVNSYLEAEAADADETVGVQRLNLAGRTGAATAAHNPFQTPLAPPKLAAASLKHVPHAV
jgi:hypothetical protein